MRNVYILFSLIALTSFSACSMKDRDQDSYGINVVLPSSIGSNASTMSIHHNNPFNYAVVVQNFNTPTQMSDFNCFGLNVLGPGIGMHPAAQCANPATGMGVVGGMISAGTTSLDMMVPAGPARVVQLWAVQSANGCPQVQELLAIGGMQALESTFGKPYIIAQNTVDVFDNVSVSMTASYVQGVNSLAFKDCGTISNSTVPVATSLGWVESSPRNNPSVNATWTAAPGIANQKIRFYSDATCTTTYGSLVDLASPSLQTYAFNAGSNGSYYFQVTSVDANNNTALSGCSPAMVIDSASPTVTIASTDNGSPTLATTVPITFTFNEAVTGFTVADIDTTNGTVSNFAGSGANYTVDFTPNNNTQGSYTINITAGKAQDLAGNNNLASTTYTQNYYRATPTLTGSPVTNSATPTLTVGNVISNVSVNVYVDSSCTTPAAVGVTATGSTKTITTSSLGSDGVKTLYAAARDFNGNQSACSVVFSVTLDTIAPTATFITATNPTVLTTIPVTLNFSEPVTGLSIAAINTAISGGTATGLSGSGSSYNFTVSPTSTITQTGIVLNLGALSASDSAGNGNVAATPYTVNFYPKPTSITGTSPDLTLTPTVTVGQTATGLTAKIYADASCVGLKGTQAASGATTNVLSSAIATNTTYWAKLQDAGGNYSACSSVSFAFIYDPLVIAPNEFAFPIGQPLSQTFSALGGSGGYSYSILSGVGSINSSSGAYTVGSRTPNTTTVVQVTDSGGRTANMTIRHTMLFTNGLVSASAVNGTSLYIGGKFTSVSPYIASGFAGLSTTDGSLSDYSIASGFNGQVNAIAIKGNFAYVGGTFTKYKMNTAQYLAKIDLTTGLLDTSFTQATGPNNPVNAIAVSNDGTKLFVGGSFTQYRGSANGNRLIKLDTGNGSLDATFNGSVSGPQNTVTSIVIGPSGYIFIGGAFTNHRSAANTGYLAKVNDLTGVADAGFTGGVAGPNAAVNALYWDGGNNSLYVGGAHTSYRGVTNGKYLTKVSETDGSMDVGFNSQIGPNGSVNALALSSDGSYIFAGGNFLTYRSVSTYYMVKVAKIDGTKNVVFNSTNGAAGGANGPVYAITVPSSGGVYIGGAFNGWRNDARASFFAKLSELSGAIDSSFSTEDYHGLDSTVTAAAASADGSKVYVGGAFHTYRGTPVRHVAKFDTTTWALDTTFTHTSPASGVEGGVVNALVYSAGYVYIGGDFGSFGGGDTSAFHLAKLDATTGNLETGSFNTVPGGGPDGPVYALTILGSDLFVGGAFTSYRGDSKGFNLAKVSATTGVLETTNFNTTASYGPSAVVNALTAYGSYVYVGGNFLTYRGSSDGTRLVKIDSTTGAMNTGFNTASNTGPNDEVYALALTSGGTDLFVGGKFTNYRGNNYGYKLAKVGASTGTLNGTFNSAATNAGNPDGDVYSLVVTGSEVFVGGQFLNWRNNPKGAFLAKADINTGVLLDSPGQFNNAATPIVGNVNNVLTLALVGSKVFAGGDFHNYQGDIAFNSACSIDSSNGLPSW